MAMIGFADFPFAAAIDHERALLDRVAGGAADRALSFWTTEACLVAPRNLTVRPGFAAAAALLAADGMRVHERDTGGDLMPQGPGIVNVTLVFATPAAAQLSIAEAYDALCRPIEALLARHGVAARRGPVPGAFCDGAHNIAVGSGKLAGTAQRWRRGRDGRTTILAHAAIICAGDLDAPAAAANRLYAACGLDRRVNPALHLRLFDLPGFGPETLATELAAAFGEKAD
jgi:lipoate-protein ligase A